LLNGSECTNNSECLSNNCDYSIIYQLSGVYSSKVYPSCLSNANANVSCPTPIINFNCDQNTSGNLDCNAYFSGNVSNMNTFTSPLSVSTVYPITVTATNTNTKVCQISIATKRYVLPTVFNPPKCPSGTEYFDPTYQCIQNINPNYDKKTYQINYLVLPIGADCSASYNSNFKCEANSYCNKDSICVASST